MINDVIAQITKTNMMLVQLNVKLALLGIEPIELIPECVVDLPEPVAAAYFNGYNMRIAEVVNELIDITSEE